VQEAISQMPYTRVEECFTRADLAFAPVNALGSLKSHADFHTFDVTVGDATIALPRVPGVDNGPRSPAKVPELGAHTNEVLNSLRNT
jgi:crotonobetainyl-CoA:carnitine CoA-transferase CaiB-like acyl-CoA transferase